MATYMYVYLYIVPISILVMTNGEFFNRIQSFDDKQITESPLWTIPGLSRSECSFQCLSDRSCVGFQLSQVKQICAGFSFTFENIPVLTTPVSGYQLWEPNAKSPAPCADDSICQTVNSACFNGSCRCDVGYDAYGGACRDIAECELFDDVFDAYANLVVMGHDLYDLVGLTLEECQQFCLQVPDCKSADYMIIGAGCYPAAYTWFEFPDGRTSKPDFYHLQRKCKMWQA